MRTLLISILLLAATQLLGSTHLYADPMFQTIHASQATSYLELLDQQKLEEAWQYSAPLFKALNDKLQWQQRIKAIRNAYGPVSVRTLRLSSHRSTYTNAPDGDYLFIQFNSTFENKANGIETVVLQCPSHKECAVINYVVN